MKTIKSITSPLFILTVLFMWGCSDIQPVSIVDDSTDSELIQMNAVSLSTDSLFVSSGVDSSGITGDGNGKYFARMIVTGIRYDLPLRSDSLLQAEAIFLDRLNPIQANGRVNAYPSFNLGAIILNGDTLPMQQRRNRIFGVDSLLGYKYQMRKSYSYESGKIYRWQVSGNNTIDSADVSIVSPSEIRVYDISPKIISADVPLSIKWSCANKIVNIFISKESGLLQKSWTPILHLKVRNTKGEVTIPPKILEILPIHQHQRFLFTFSSESRFTRSISGYSDSVLVEAASLHNILMNVGP